jgi:hypothetical protein
MEDGFNLYLYVGNNPITLNDPTGNQAVRPVKDPETGELGKPVGSTKSKRRESMKVEGRNYILEAGPAKVSDKRGPDDPYVNEQGELIVPAGSGPPYGGSLDITGFADPAEIGPSDLDIENKEVPQAQLKKAPKDSFRVNQPSKVHGTGLKFTLKIGSGTEVGAQLKSGTVKLKGSVGGDLSVAKIEYYQLFGKSDVVKVHGPIPFGRRKASMQAAELSASAGVEAELGLFSVGRTYNQTIISGKKGVEFMPNPWTKPSDWAPPTATDQISSKKVGGVRVSGVSGPGKPPYFKLGVQGLISGEIKIEPYSY